MYIHHKYNKYGNATHVGEELEAELAGLQHAQEDGVALWYKCMCIRMCCVIDGLLLVFMVIRIELKHPSFIHTRTLYSGRFMAFLIMSRVPMISRSIAGSTPVLLLLY